MASVDFYIYVVSLVHWIYLKSLSDECISLRLIPCTGKQIIDIPREVIEKRKKNLAIQINICWAGVTKASRQKTLRALLQALGH